MEFKNFGITNDNHEFKVGFVLACICLILHTLFLSLFNWLMLLIFLSAVIYILGVCPFKKIHGMYPWSKNA